MNPWLTPWAKLFRTNAPLNLALMRGTPWGALLSFYIFNGPAEFPTPRKPPARDIETIDHPIPMEILPASSPVPSPTVRTRVVTPLDQVNDKCSGIST